MDDTILIDPNLWKGSRAGASAGRGFRFQDAAGALIAARVWSGELDALAVVPEGVDDLTLHRKGLEVRVQVKSRHDPRGRFKTAEIAEFLTKGLGDANADELRSGTCRLVLLLERAPESLAVSGWQGRVADHSQSVAQLAPLLSDALAGADLTLAEFLAATSIVHEEDPIEDCVALIQQRKGANEAVSRLAAHRLRHLVGEGADTNFKAPHTRPASLDATNVEALVDAVLALVAPGAMFPAVEQGLCEAVTFAPLAASAFYEGVDTVPGHVSAGLVLERPEVMSDISAGLERYRCALITGPSGAGKSAAAWLFAYQNRHAVRWYRIRRMLPGQGHLLIQLARSLEASPGRPVGFVLDDVGQNYAAMWGALSAEVRTEPGVLLLGTIREEDLFLLGDLQSTSITRPVLDTALAEAIWIALKTDQRTNAPHWREPFEESGGLLLEYAHLLTSGERLSATIVGQVRRRLAEERDAELTVLRGVVPIARFGGSVDSERLRRRVGLSEGEFARALARLVAEHTIRVGQDGSLAGLHQIRSTALYDAMHAQFPRARVSELAEAIDVMRPDTFVGVLPALLRSFPDDDDVLLQALAARSETLTILELASAFYALGLASCDRVAAAWTAIVEAEGLEARNAALIYMVGLAGTPLNLPNFEKANAAISRSAETHQADLRTLLLARIISGLPVAASLADYNELAAALVPIAALHPPPPFASLPKDGLANAPLDQVLAVATTVREFGPALAEQFVSLFGGTEALLSRIHEETVWATQPSMSEDGEQLVVSSNIRLIGDEAQPDTNKTVVTHCDRLFAAAPRATVAASCLLGWDGSPAAFQNFTLAEKHLPRAAAPAPVRIAWNRAILRAIQRRTGASSQSGRARDIVGAIEELADMLQDATEVYCRGEPPKPIMHAMVHIRSLLNTFISAPSAPPGVSSPLDTGDYTVADDAYDFVTSVVTLSGKLLEKIDRPIMASCEAAKLSAAAAALQDADSWRWVEAAPLEALASLEETLRDLEVILGIAHADPAAFERMRLKAERTGKGKLSRKRFASDARALADQLGQRKGEEVRAALAAGGIESEVAYRSLDDVDAPYWPRVEFAVLTPVDDLVTFLTNHLSTFVELREQWRDLGGIAFAPVREGKVCGSWAMVPSLQGVLPDTTFKAKWSEILPLPLLEEGALDAFGAATGYLMQILAALANRDRALNDEEEAHIAYLAERLEQPRRYLEALDDDAAVAVALDLINELAQEAQAQLAGEDANATMAEMAGAIRGELNDTSMLLASARIDLTEYDIAGRSPCAE